MFLSLDDNRINLIKKYWLCVEQRMLSVCPFHSRCTASMLPDAFQPSGTIDDAGIFIFTGGQKDFQKLFFFIMNLKKNLEENENLLDWIEATNTNV